MNVILLTFGFSQNSLPAADESFEGKICKIPDGRPALSAKTPNANAEKGVNWEGRATNAHPAANAGAALRVIIALGKFQGVIEAATPIGCLITVIRLSA